MSVRLMAAVFDLELPPLEKLVLLAMADHARDDGTGCYPSIATLARKTSLSRRGVQKIVRRLEEARFIASLGRGNGGRTVTTEYKITPEKGEQGSLFSGPKERTAKQKRANLSAQKGEPGSPEPSGTVSEAAVACKQEDSMWTVLGIAPCGPPPFQQLLESRWASRNGRSPAAVLGETVDAWEAVNGEKPRRAGAFFRALAEIRRREREPAKPALDEIASIPPDVMEQCR